MQFRLTRALLLSILLILGLFSVYQIKAETRQPFNILSPGSNSKVTAPIHVRALVMPGDGEMVRVILVDWQQNLLARQVLRLDADGRSEVELVTDLLFEIPVETTSAILSIVTQDQANRPISIRSVPVTLQSSGEARIEPQLEVSTWLDILHPSPGLVINETPLFVSGSVRPITDRPVIFELVNVRGNAIITRQLGVETPGDWTDFEIALPYLPSSTIQDVRLVIRQTSEFPGVNAILDSIPLTLAP